MIKNMEWGAVAFLSNSKYGKNSEINTNSMSEYKTGYSGTTLYNDTTTGILASTTGTIYGVYDMSGGAAEYTMGNMVNSSNVFYPSDSGTWNDSVFPLSKYYDKYSYSVDSTEKASLSRGLLGDGTKEVIKNFSSENGKWFSDSNSFVSNNNSWFLRGGSINDGTSSGIYAVSGSTGSNNENNSSRPVLTISRNMPWLNNN